MTLNFNYILDLDEATLMNYIEDYDAAEHSLADFDELERFIHLQLTLDLCNQLNLPGTFDERFYADSEMITTGLYDEQLYGLRAFIKEGVHKFIDSCYDAG